MDENAVAAVAKTIRKVSKAIVQVTGDPDFNVILNNGPTAGK